MKSKMGSIEFCKLNLAFEEDLRGGKSSSKSVKVIENGDFRGFDSSQAGRMDDKIKNASWKILCRNRFLNSPQKQQLFLCCQMRSQFEYATV